MSGLENFITTKDQFLPDPKLFPQSSNLEYPVIGSKEFLDVLIRSQDFQVNLIKVVGKINRKPLVYSVQNDKKIELGKEEASFLKKCIPSLIRQYVAFGFCYWKFFLNSDQKLDIDFPLNDVGYLVWRYDKDQSKQRLRWYDVHTNAVIEIHHRIEQRPAMTEFTDRKTGVVTKIVMPMTAIQSLVDLTEDETFLKGVYKKTEFKNHAHKPYLQISIPPQVYSSKESVLLYSRLQRGNATYLDFYKVHGYTDPQLAMIVGTTRSQSQVQTQIMETSLNEATKNYQNDISFKDGICGNFAKLVFEERNNYNLELLKFDERKILSITNKLLGFPTTEEESESNRLKSIANQSTDSMNSFQSACADFLELCLTQIERERFMFNSKKRNGIPVKQAQALANTVVISIQRCPYIDPALVMAIISNPLVPMETKEALISDTSGYEMEASTPANVNRNVQKKKPVDMEVDSEKDEEGTKENKKEKKKSSDGKQESKKKEKKVDEEEKKEKEKKEKKKA